jgi:predicted nucleic acid-binding protein
VREWIVTDASVSLLWVRRQKENPLMVRRARQLYRDILDGRYFVAIPFHWRLEIGNALRRTVAAGEFDLRRAQKAIRWLLGFAQNHCLTCEPTSPWDELIRNADAWSVSLYDVLYLDLAAKIQATFWTADLRLYRHWHSRLDLRWLSVGWIGFYPETAPPLVSP